MALHALNRIGVQTLESVGAGGVEVGGDGFEGKDVAGLEVRGRQTRLLIRPAPVNVLPNSSFRPLQAGYESDA